MKKADCFAEMKLSVSLLDPLRRAVCAVFVRLQTFCSFMRVCECKDVSMCFSKAIIEERFDY